MNHFPPKTADFVPLTINSFFVVIKLGQMMFEAVKLGQTMFEAEVPNPTEDVHHACFTAMGVCFHLLNYTHLLTQ